MVANHSAYGRSELSGSEIEIFRTFLAHHIERCTFGHYGRRHTSWVER